MGESCSSFPWPGGVHRSWSVPIGTNTKPSRGTGLAGVAAHAVAAGIIASRSGRPRAAPVLLRNVRLGIAFFVKNIALSFCRRSPVIRHFTRCTFRAPHLKRDALHD